MVYLGETSPHQVALKVQGKFKGGQKRIDRERVRQLVSEGVNSTAIGRELNVSRMTVHRIKNELGI